MARDVIFKYSKEWTSHDSNVTTNTRHIWSVLFYGVEVWTIKNSNERKLEAFKMWIYRRVLKIPWTAGISNDEVVRRMNINRQLILMIKNGKRYAYDDTY